MKKKIIASVLASAMLSMACSMGVFADNLTIDDVDTTTIPAEVESEYIDLPEDISEETAKDIRLNSSETAQSVILDTFEADINEIVIYTSTAVSESVLAAAVVLEEDGNTVNDVTVEKVTVLSGCIKSSDYKYDNAYRIKKDGGFDVGAVYRLTISGLPSQDGTWSKAFKINSIYVNDFSDETRVDWEFKQTNPSTTYHGDNKAAVEDGVMKITTGEKNSENHVLTFDYDNMLTQSDYTIEFDFTPVEASSGNWIRMGVSNDFKTAASSAACFHLQSGTIRTYVIPNGSSFNWSFIANFGKPAVGVTGRYKMIIKDGRYLLYVDGEKYTDYKVRDTATSGAFAIRFFQNSSQFIIDNLKITKGVQMIDVFADKDEYDITDDVTLSFGTETKIDTIVKDNFTIKDGENNIEDFEVEPIDAYTAKIKFKKEYKKNYTIEVGSGVESVEYGACEYTPVKVKTMDPPFDLSSFEKTSDKFKAVIKNNRVLAPVVCMTTICQYDADNRLISVAGGKYTVAMGDDEAVESNITSGAVKAKCFVWNNFTDMDTLFEEEIDND